MVVGMVAGLIPSTTAEQAPRPRTLVLALDGVPFRLAEEARDAGAFAGWPSPVPMVSTFPSLTNVGFTAMFQAWGASRAPGYEVQYYDQSRNEIVGGTPFGYSESLYDWRSYFDVTGRSVGSKLSIYTAPKRKARKELDEAARTVLESPKELILAHVGGTDAMMHIRGDRAVVKFLRELDGWIDELKRKHLDLRGAPLRVILVSDHGNTDHKIHMAGGMRRRLRKAGFAVVDRLEKPDDIIAATFGIVGYGVLFLDPSRAENAALACAEDKDVALAAWQAGPQELGVVSAAQRASVRWQDRGATRYFAYQPLEGDPLRLSDAVATLNERGRLDREGFASEHDWLDVSFDAEYPDAPRRLTDALTGAYVENAGTVLLSFTPGVAWGWMSAHASSKLQGGRLEGTHGGLDRESTLGFFLTDDASIQPGRAVRADRVLVDALGRDTVYARGAAAGSNPIRAH